MSTDRCRRDCGAAGRDTASRGPVASCDSVLEVERLDQDLQDLAHRLAAVADGVLLLGLPVRPPSRPPALGDEERVVAEAVRRPPGACARRPDIWPVPCLSARRRAVPKPSRTRTAPGVDQRARRRPGRSTSWLLSMSSLLGAGPACRPHPGHVVECVHLEARVVCELGRPVSRPAGEGLDQGVAFEGPLRLGRLRLAGRPPPGRAPPRPDAARPPGCAAARRASTDCRWPAPGSPDGSCEHLVLQAPEPRAAVTVPRSSRVSRSSR